MRSRLSLTADDVGSMMEAALAAALSAGRNVSVAITDDAGVLLSFHRMDGARSHTVDFAMRKARAAALVGVSTALIEAMTKDRPGSVEMSPGTGGVPAMAGADCVGGIGVSGARPEEDDMIAKAGLAALPPS